MAGRVDDVMNQTTSIRGSMPRSGARGPEFENPDTVAAPITTPVVYECAAGHRVTRRLHHRAKIPSSWVCHCGQDATLNPTADATDATDASAPAPDSKVPGQWYTHRHRNLLFGRRTVDELQTLLAERLETAP